MKSQVLLVAVTLAMAATLCSAADQDISAAVRGFLEASLRERAGIGFASFECDGSPPLGPGDRFLCLAVDEEGDRLRYTLEVDDDGSATVVRAEQRAESLAVEDLQALEAPCRAFLATYDRRDWNALFADLHPELQKKLGSVENTAQLLDFIRDFLGDVNTAVPTWFAVRDSGEQELEYRLQCASGEGQARFQFAFDDERGWQILAFIVTAQPGSPEQSVLIERAALQALSPVVDSPIERIEAPFAALERRGDVIEGTAYLVDGRQLAVRAEQFGLRDDFDTNDYRFSVLDVRFLVMRALAGEAGAPESVECAAEVVPDGGETTCVVTLEGGATRELVIRRQGGGHRLFEARSGAS